MRYGSFPFKEYYVPRGSHAERELRRLLKAMGFPPPKGATRSQLYALYFALRERGVKGQERVG
ncbi:MAG: hypothetical protein IMW99_01195 [Firmicutes bacterium]|nr:hypothetical protein [Bacillota bacterium]